MVDSGNIVFVCIACGVLLILFFPIRISCFISLQTSLSYTIKCAGLVLFDSKRKSTPSKSKKKIKKKAALKTKQTMKSSIQKASTIFELFFDPKNLPRIIRMGRALKQIIKWGSGSLQVTYGNTDPYALSMIHSRWYPFEALFSSGSLVFTPKYGSSLFELNAQAQFSVTLARTVLALGVIGISIPYRGLIKIYRGGR